MDNKQTLKQGDPNRPETKEDGYRAEELLIGKYLRNNPKLRDKVLADMRKAREPKAEALLAMDTAEFMEMADAALIKSLLKWEKAQEFRLQKRDKNKNYIYM